MTTPPSPSSPATPTSVPTPLAPDFVAPVPETSTSVPGPPDSNGNPNSAGGPNGVELLYRAAAAVAALFLLVTVF